MELGDADRLVIFGISGDLGYKMTLPALYQLQRRGLLKVPVVGVAANDWGPDGLANRARDAIMAHHPDDFDEKTFGDLMAKMSYIHGDFADPALYSEVAEAITGSEAPCFYLEIPPGLFGMVARGLAAAKLLGGRARLVVEKPFGHDLQSAKDLAAELHKCVREEQLFRIDHFLGKEPVQDIIYLRFANSMLEPLWNRKHVAAVMITMAESFGVDDRGRFYDPVGCLRDVVQNHLLQILALTGLEPPAGGSLSQRRLDFFRTVETVHPANAVMGQYAGYRLVKGVSPESETETFVAVRLEIDSWRWAGVPVFIRAGKKMPMDATEIVVRLEKPPMVEVDAVEIDYEGHDDIVLRIGGNAGVSLSMRVKQPGKDLAEPELLTLDFTSALGDVPTPYERLLSDAMAGDHSLFPEQAVIEETWRIVERLVDDPPPIDMYQPGSWGPDAATLLTRHVGGWREPESEGLGWAIDHAKSGPPAQGESTPAASAPAG